MGGTSQDDEDDDDGGWDPALDDDEEEQEEEGDSVTRREREAGTDDEDEDDGKPLGYLTDEDYEAYVVTDLLDGQPEGSPAREERGPAVTGILVLLILGALLLVVALLS